MALRSPLLLDARALLDADRLLAAGMADRRASFEVSLGRLPQHNGFAVVAGVESTLERLDRAGADDEELAQLRKKLSVSDALAKRLATSAQVVDVDAMPDGSIAFPRAPIVIVEGPLLEAMLVARLARDVVQSNTAIATRAARLQIASGAEIIDASSAGASLAGTSLEIARAAFVGGASATTNVAAAIALGIPLRATSSLDLGGAREAAANPWGDSPVDHLTDLGEGDDEEAIVLELKRRGDQSGGLYAHGFRAACPPHFPMRASLVAIEENGAWAARRGLLDDATILPGRKRASRFTDANGRITSDLVHLANERLPPAKTRGAVSASPTTRSLMRAGRRLEGVEPASVARDRSIAARQTLPPDALYLRAPGRFKVDLSKALSDLRDEYKP